MVPFAVAALMTYFLRDDLTTVAAEAHRRVDLLEALLLFYSIFTLILFHVDIIICPL